MTLFCSQGCANEWLSDHADNIANRRPIPFITERRVAEGTYDIRENESNINITHIKLYKGLTLLNNNIISHI